ncbi:MAG: hypothetical protein IAF58_15360 [Leptolyngbya sp.]|nr:hypothetical protein [Candidatus Melainabacteria bacterium]
MTSSETAVQDIRQTEARSEESALSRQATSLFVQNDAEAFLQRVQNTLAGRTLEAQGVLPSLTISDARTPHATPVARPGENGAQDRTVFTTAETDAPPTPRRWTMAINLASSGGVDVDGQRRPIGADSKINEILALAERTRDTPVTLYVQATLPLPTEAGPDGSILTNQRDQQVATYRIENGQVTMLERQPTQGAQRDIERLLERASQRAGDGNLGLILQSHGFASGGIGGDSGEVNLPQLEAAITNGLRQSGRTAVDVLNFDSCSMGDLNVMEAMQGEARHIVGSAELERAFGPDVDGQNMRATLGALLENPNLTPAQYATRSIELARAGANDDAGNIRNTQAGTETLAHFDQSRYPQFASSLDTLGAVLTDIVRDPSRREAMLGVIGGLRAFGDESARSGNFTADRRDLGTFLNGLESRFADGSLGTATPEITEAIRRTREELRNFVRDYHGEPYQGYNQMSGLSVFLPTRELLNVDDQIRANSPSQMMLDSLTSDGKQTRFSSRENLAESMTYSAIAIGQFADTAQMTAAIARIRNAGDEAAFGQAITALREQVETFQAGPDFQRLVEAGRAENLTRRDRVYDEQLHHVPPQWRGFLDAFRGR